MGYYANGKQPDQLRQNVASDQVLHYAYIMYILDYE